MILTFPCYGVKVIIGESLFDGFSVFVGLVRELFRRRRFLPATPNKGMLTYALICLSLSLAGVAGLLFFYMAYLERLDRARKKRIHELERHCKYLSNRLRNAETQIVEQNDLIDAIYDEMETEVEEEEEVWADVIEERW